MASLGDVFTRLAKLDLDAATLDDSGMALLSNAVQASRHTLAEADFHAMADAFDFLHGCTSLRVLHLGGAPPATLGIPF